MNGYRLLMILMSSALSMSVHANEGCATPAYQEQFQSLSVVNEAHIRSMLQNIGISGVGTIKIRQLPTTKNASYAHVELELGLFGIVDWRHTTGEGYVLLVGDDFWQLTLDEQRFVLAHEIAHIEKNHIKKSCTSVCAFSLAAFLSVVAYLNSDSALKRKFPTTMHLLATSLLGISIVAGYGVLQKFSHVCELEADECAAKRLGSVQGGIKFFERLQKITGKASNIDKPSLGIMERLYTLYTTRHPDNQTRIDSLKKLQAA